MTKRPEPPKPQEPQNVMFKGNVDKSVQERVEKTSCAWWEPHQWSRWEVRDSYHSDRDAAIRIIQQRSCLICNAIDLRTVSNY